MFLKIRIIENKTEHYFVLEITNDLNDISFKALVKEIEIDETSLKHLIRLIRA